MTLHSHGHFLPSAGGGFVYRVLGPVCMLYDREELPWPCCRLSWKGKEPSWNRVGRRFVADISTKRFPSYACMGMDRSGHVWTTVLTLYSVPLSPDERRWWYSNILPVGHAYPGLLPTRLTSTSSLSVEQVLVAC